MKLSLLFALLLFTTFSLAQNREQPAGASLQLGVLGGWNGIQTSLRSSGYFRNFESTSDPGFAFGLEMTLTTRSGLVAKTGLTYLSHHSATDSLNIPPLAEDDIWSSFNFRYTSFNLPLQLGYRVPFGNLFSITAEGGLVLRFTGGHSFEETVSEPNFFEPVDPANIYRYELFGVALSGGLTLIFLEQHTVRPFLSGSYFTGTSNYHYRAGYPPNDHRQPGNIVDKGWLLFAGVRFKLR